MWLGYKDMSSQIAGGELANKGVSRGRVETLGVVMCTGRMMGRIKPVTVGSEPNLFCVGTGSTRIDPVRRHANEIDPEQPLLSPVEDA